MRINRFRPLAGFASIHNNPTPPDDDDDGRRCVLGRGSEKLFYGRAPSVLKELSTHMVFCRAAEGEENNVCLCIWWVCWITKNAGALCRLILFAVRIFNIFIFCCISFVRRRTFPSLAIRAGSASRNTIKWLCNMQCHSRALHQWQ